jgi:hypothetical protein
MRVRPLGDEASAAVAVEGRLHRRRLEDLFVEFGQGFVSMSPALRDTEAALARGQGRHGNHPVLTMCAANAVVTTDPAGNRKLNKAKSATTDRRHGRAGDGFRGCADEVERRRLRNAGHLKEAAMNNRAYSVLSVKSIDEDKRIIRGVATTPSVDRVGDIIDPLGVKFENPLPLLWQHEHDKPIGSVKFDKPTKAGIEFEAEIASTDEPGT